MSTCYIRIDLDNDAFMGGYCGDEVARILRNLADKVENKSRTDLDGFTPAPVDSNGNCVGTVDFEIDDQDPEEEARQQRELEAKTFVRKLTSTQITLCLEAAGSPPAMGTWLEQRTQRLVDLIVDEELSIGQLEWFLNGQP